EPGGSFLFPHSPRWEPTAKPGSRASTIRGVSVAPAPPLRLFRERSGIPQVSDNRSPPLSGSEGTAKVGGFFATWAFDPPHPRPLSPAGRGVTGITESRHSPCL